VEAVKTEYKKIVFDSKSEAVFARTLDIAGHHWKYHPKEHCGHVWDFLVWRNCSYVDHRLPSYIYARVPWIYIEYKPSMPTNTYVDNLTEKMRSDPRESIVVWGNPWDGVDKEIDGPQDCCYRIYPIFCSMGKYGWGDFIRLADNGGDWPTSFYHETWPVLGITEGMAQEAKRYRFDLNHNGL
jgi:hypothetical protein